MKKILTILALAVIFITSSYATSKINPLVHEIEDQSLKLAIDLGNISKFSDKDIDTKVKWYTTKFLAGNNAAKYNIVIKANLDSKQTEDLKLDAVSFQVDIKGTLAEVKKELKTISKVINDMKKEYQQF